MFSLAQNTMILPVDIQASMAASLPLFMLAFVLGACLGSFAQATALRLNRDEDPVRQPSRCRSCSRPLNLRQNIPLLGWLMTWGKCRHCGAAFSINYMLVELAMGLLVGGIAVFFAWPIALILTIGMLLMVICALTDLDAMLLHLPVMGMLGLVGFAASFLPFWPLSPLASLLGMVSVVILITVINGLYTLLRGEAGFGSGDYWLMGAVGLWLGPVLAVILFFLASLLGAVIGIVLMMQKKGDGQTALPFGVFISLVFICWPILNILVILRL